MTFPAIDPTSTRLPISWIDPKPLSPSALKRKLLKPHRDAMQAGDTAHRFSSPLETWEKLRGVAGVVIVRNGKVVEEVVKTRC